MLPARSELIALFEQACVDPELERVRQALLTGRYVLDDYELPAYSTAALDAQQLGLLIWLARQCKTRNSVEIGFGFGSSATAILAARRAEGHEFRHIVFDPGPMSETILAHLLRTYPQMEFRRIHSEIGLGQLLGENGWGSADLVFIDGDHHFENVVADFLLADHLVKIGGYIVIDDFDAPAIEAAINYVAKNRADYQLEFAGTRTAVLLKVSSDAREWCAFTPFLVPNRKDWEPPLPK